jgi:hypothetical protein
MYNTGLVRNHHIQSEPIVISYKAPLLKKQGNFYECQLDTIILLPSGRKDRLAIDIYTDIKSWFRPKRNGQSKMQTRGFQTSYEQLAKKYGCCRKTVKQKIVLLEELGLISRDCTNEFKGGRLFNNILNISVWKDTPHFFNEDGLDKTAADIAKFSNLKSTLIHAQDQINQLEEKEQNYPHSRGKKLPHHISNTTLNTTKTDNHDEQGVNANFSQNSDFIETNVLNEQNDFSYIPADVLNGDIEIEEMHVSRLAGGDSYPEAVPEQQTTNIVETKPEDSKLRYNIPQSKRTEIGRDGKIYYTTPLVEFEYTPKLLREIISLSEKKHFTPERVVGIIQNILRKQPDKQIGGGRRGYINYMVKALNGEVEYDAENTQTSIAAINASARIELEARIMKNEIQWD